MKHFFQKFKSILFMLLILGLASLLCWLLGALLHTDNYISMVFTFAVFLVARFTEKMIYGVIAAVISIVAINYIFTYPYFAFNFTLPGYLLTTICVLSISLATSTLTLRLKRQSELKAQAEKETMRANLLRAISHDLRTPLTTIEGSCSALLDAQDQLSKQQQTALLLGIRQDSQWLIRMVENLLLVTRITDSKQVQLTKNPELVEEVLESVISKFQKRYPGVELSVESPHSMVFVPMDAVLIEQVLGNLLENAVLHGRTTTKITVTVCRQGANAVFCIADNGVGIASQRLSTLFSTWTDRPNPDAKRSMGIGLSVCRSIVQAHGGTILAQNGPGGGAVLRFTLPMEENA